MGTRRARRQMVQIRACLAGPRTRGAPSLQPLGCSVQRGRRTGGYGGAGSPPPSSPPSRSPPHLHPLRLVDALLVAPDVEGVFHVEQLVHVSGAARGRARSRGRHGRGLFSLSTSAGTRRPEAGSVPSRSTLGDVVFWLPDALVRSPDRWRKRVAGHVGTCSQTTRAEVAGIEMKGAELRR